MRRKNPLAELLTGLLRDPSVEAASVQVWIRHRGAPDGVRAIGGDEIARAFARGLALKDGTELPLHRVLRVLVAGRTRWVRASSAGPDPARR